MSWFGVGDDRHLWVLKLVAPQDGGWSLTPMENLLRGLRGIEDAVALELFGAAGVVGYTLRTNNGPRLEGVLHSYFPQARVEHRIYDSEEDRRKLEAEDWMRLDEDEYALALPLSLSKPGYLPLMIWDDNTLNASQSDPLAGIIGVLASATRSAGEGGGGDRLGVRLVIRPAEENWGKRWQNRMQARRDGDDRDRPAVSDRSGGGGGMAAMGVMAAFAGVAFGNWWLYDQGMYGYLAALDGGLAALGAGALWGWRKFAGNRRRAYMDEELVEGKLKSLAFWSELQLVRIYRNLADELAARQSLDELLEALRQFDHPAGNQLRAGRILRYQGVDIAQGGAVKHPFLGVSQSLGYLDRGRAMRSALSAREVACLWHPPLGADEMASMERTAAGVLIPYLEDLAAGGDDAGPLVGHSEGLDREIRLPESAIRKHALFVGKSGVGKSTLIKQVLAHKMQRKAKGLDNDAIVVVDPHADLVRDVLKFVPPEIAHKVRLLDFGRTDRVPAINLLDPELFPDRDRCVDTIVQTVRYLWEHWGNRLEDLLKRSLLILYEYNAHADTARDQMLTMLDILRLLEDGEETGQGRNTRSEMNPFQRHVFERVTDAGLKRWFMSYLNWGRETRSEAVGPVQSRMGAYQSSKRAKVVLGQRDSTILLGDVLREGQVLLVATAQGTIGKQPAALVGGTIVSLVDDAMRRQEDLARAERNRCLLVCDEFQAVTGADWEGMLAEIRKFGGSLMLATQSVARLDSDTRKLKEALLGNIGCVVAYQMSAQDARIMSAEMDSERVTEQYLVNLNPYHCYVRINSDTKAYPTFSLKTLPPPDDVYGSDQAVQAVLDGLPKYTFEWEDALARVEAMAAASMDDYKVGLDGQSDLQRGGPAGGRPPRGGGEPRKGEGSLFERVMTRGDQVAAAPAPAAAVAERPAPARGGRNDRVESGTLKGLPKDAVADSRVRPEVLEEIIRSNPNDPGIRQALDKHLGDRTDAERRRVRTEERAAIREEEAQRAAQQVERQVEQRLREETAAARAEARAEVLKDLTGSAEGAPREPAVAGSSSGGGSRRGRNPGAVRRPGGGGG